MRIIVAPDAFKESASAQEAAGALKTGIERVAPGWEVEAVPMSDGGEGTTQSLVDATGGTFVEETVSGPLGSPVTAFYGVSSDRSQAFIEMAAASGLELVPQAERNPLHTSTAGTGDLIRAALDAGARHFIIGIGGSATNDGGAGMLQALGVRLLDTNSYEVNASGGTLASIAHMDFSSLDPRLDEARIEVACDVDNPLLGHDGAAYVYGPQKGADPPILEQLESGMVHYADVLEAAAGKSVRNLPGAGAAGGLGAAFLALGAELKPGIETVMNVTGFRERLHSADLVITGEGKLDEQTLYGKTIAGIAEAAAEARVSVIAVAGSVEVSQEELLEAGIASAFSITPRPMALDEAMMQAAFLLEGTGASLAGVIQAIR